jgi:DNA primase
MFPICNDRGEVIAFSGRTLEANPKAAKYVNSPETLLFTKGNVLFGLHRSIRSLIDKKSAIVCEGQIDLITAFEAGVTNVIAPQGTAFTDKQARILKRYVEEVVLCFDSDAAGEKAAERSLESLLGENLGVRVAAMPPGEDPDSLIRREGGPAFIERMAAAKDFFAFQVERMTKAPEFQTPKGRANAAHKLAGWISLIKDTALREAVMGNVTMRLEMSMRQFSEIVSKVRLPQKGQTADPVPENLATPLTDPAFRLLALAALHDEAACEWLRNAPFRELLARETDAGLVVKILESGFQPGERGSQQTFLAGLPAADEATISELLSERPPAHALMQASDCWNALVRRQIQRHLEGLQARLRTPGLSLEETLKLQKEVLDQQTSLLEIARPLSPPLA